VTRNPSTFKLQIAFGDRDDEFNDEPLVQFETDSNELAELSIDNSGTTKMRVTLRCTHR
jgi:hypothetical protein